MLQLRHYQSEREIFLLKPASTAATHFGALVTFLAHVAPCYPEPLRAFPGEIMSLLKNSAEQLDPELRRVLVQSLILMRNRKLLEPTACLQLFFGLFRVQDKALRKIVYTHIVNDIRALNEKSTNHKVNRDLQNFMYTMLRDESETAAKKSLDVMIDLYRRRVWTDARTVNVISSACFSKVTKIFVAAMRFFLGIDEAIDKDEEEKDVKDIDTMVASKRDHSHSKKTRSRLRDKERDEKKRRQLDAAKKKASEEAQPRFPAIELLNDPQVGRGRQPGGRETWSRWTGRSLRRRCLQSCLPGGIFCCA